VIRRTNSVQEINQIVQMLVELWMKWRNKWKDGLVVQMKDLKNITKTDKVLSV